MKKMFVAGVATMALTLAVPALAQTQGGEIVITYKDDVSTLDPRRHVVRERPRERACRDEREDFREGHGATSVAAPSAATMGTERRGG